MQPMTDSDEQRIERACVVHLRVAMMRY